MLKLQLTIPMDDFSLACVLKRYYILPTIPLDGKESI